MIVGKRDSDDLRTETPMALRLAHQSSSRFPSSIHTLNLLLTRKSKVLCPNSPYELDLPSDILDHFHTPSLSSALNHPQNRKFSASR